MAYPEWSYFPRNQRPPDWAPTVIEIIAAAENSINTEKDKGPSCDAVLAAIAPGLVGFGFQVESSKARANKIDDRSSTDRTVKKPCRTRSTLFMTSLVLQLKSKLEEAR